MICWYTGHEIIWFNDEISLGISPEGTTPRALCQLLPQLFSTCTWRNSGWQFRSKFECQDIVRHFGFVLPYHDQNIYINRLLCLKLLYREKMGAVVEIFLFPTFYWAWHISFTSRMCSASGVEFSSSWMSTSMQPYQSAAVSTFFHIDFILTLFRPDLIRARRALGSSGRRPRIPYLI